MKTIFKAFITLLMCICLCFAFTACEITVKPKDDVQTNPPKQDTLPPEEENNGGNGDNEENNGEHDEQRPVFPENFNEIFKEEFATPCFEDDAVPQGIGVCNVTYQKTNESEQIISVTQQFYFISANPVDSSPSRIYVFGADDGYIGYVTANDLDGNTFNKQFGGLALNSKTIWIGCENKIYVAKASEGYKDIANEIIEKATNNGKINFTASFNANCNASFLFYFDDSRYSSITYDRLYVGENHKKESDTNSAHNLKTPCGYDNTAFMYEYSVSYSDNVYGLTTISDDGVDKENQVPKIQKIFSLPENIQGIAYSGRTGYGSNDGILILSERLETEYSHLLCFNWATVMSAENAVTYSSLYEKSFTYEGIFKTIDGQQIAYTDSTLRVYYIDKNDEKMFINDYAAPTLSSGLCVFTPTEQNSSPAKRVYIVFEKLDKVYSFIPHEK